MSLHRRSGICLAGFVARLAASGLCASAQTLTTTPTFNNIGVVVDRCFFHHTGVGVALKRATDFNTIQHCVFTESPIATWSWHAVKDSGSDYEAGGVLVYGSPEANRGNVIRFCTFTNLFDGSHLYSDNASGPTENLDFHNNVLEHCVDDGLETDGAGSNCRIYFNRFHDFLTGVSVAPAAIGPTYVFRNILSDWRPSEEFDGYPFKFNVSSALPIQWVHLYHNTCHTAVPGQAGFRFIINPAAHDYYLPPDSDLIDQAVILPGINDDYLGAAPDIGALEFGMEAKRISADPQGLTIDWHVGASGKYHLQSTANLGQSVWNAIGDPIQAERSTLQTPDPSPREAQRFYRLQHAPP